MRKAGILISSDKCFSGLREDRSGKAIAEILTSKGYEIAETVIVPDEKELIANALEKFAKAMVHLVITTGGTGFSPRDVTPEATKQVIDRDAPGISEAIRAKSMALTPKAMLSRGVSGIKNKTLIINLPGSEKAVRESLDVIIDVIPHGIDIIWGDASECGKKAVK